MNYVRRREERRWARSSARGKAQVVRMTDWRGESSKRQWQHVPRGCLSDERRAKVRPAATFQRGWGSARIEAMPLLACIVESGRRRGWPVLLFMCWRGRSNRLSSRRAEGGERQEEKDALGRLRAGVAGVGQAARPRMDGRDAAGGRQRGSARVRRTTDEREAGHDDEGGEGTRGPTRGLGDVERAA